MDRTGHALQERGTDHIERRESDRSDRASSFGVSVFPPIYVALVRVGEASGTLDRVLEVLGDERERAAAVRQRVAETTRYPAFLLFAATCVLTFFLLFVLPQFAGFFRESHAKLDPIVHFASSQKALQGEVGRHLQRVTGRAGADRAHSRVNDRGNVLVLPLRRVMIGI